MGGMVGNEIDWSLSGRGSSYFGRSILVRKPWLRVGGDIIPVPLEGYSSFNRSTLIIYNAQYHLRIIHRILFHFISKKRTAKSKSPPMIS